MLGLKTFKQSAEKLYQGIFGKRLQTEDSSYGKLTYLTIVPPNPWPTNIMEDWDNSETLSM